MMVEEVVVVTEVVTEVVLEEVVAVVVVSFQPFSSGLPWALVKSCY